MEQVKLKKREKHRGITIFDCFQPVRQNVFARGHPAQRTKTGTQPQHPGWQSWKGCHLTGSVTTDSNTAAVRMPTWARCSKQLRSPQETSQPRVCINWGILHCFRAPTWLQTLAAPQLLPIPMHTFVWPQKNLNLNVLKERCYESTRPWSGQIGRHNKSAQIRGDLQGATVLQLRLSPLSSCHWSIPTLG